METARQRVDRILETLGKEADDRQSRQRITRLMSLLTAEATELSARETSARMARQFAATHPGDLPLTNFFLDTPMDIDPPTPPTALDLFEVYCNMSAEKRIELTRLAVELLGE